MLCVFELAFLRPFPDPNTHTQLQLNSIDSATKINCKWIVAHRLTPAASEVIHSSDKGVSCEHIYYIYIYTLKAWTFAECIKSTYAVWPTQWPTLLQFTGSSRCGNAEGRHLTQHSTAQKQRSLVWKHRDITETYCTLTLLNSPTQETHKMPHDHPPMLLACFHACLMHEVSSAPGFPALVLVNQLTVTPCFWLTWQGKTNKVEIKSTN